MADIATSSAYSVLRSEDAVYAKVTWRWIPFLFICYLFSYLDRASVGFAKLLMTSDLKFSETMYGLGAGLFFFDYFLFDVPSNIILEKFGARKWISRIIVTWGLISGSMMFVRGQDFLCYAIPTGHRRGGPRSRPCS